MRSELDAGSKYTPGQKFAHWEHKGVKLRVEVGPREAARKRCTLAKTFQAGGATANPNPNPSPDPNPNTLTCRTALSGAGYLP